VDEEEMKTYHAEGTWIPMPKTFTHTCCKCGKVHKWQVRVVEGKVQIRITEGK
jgi:hypothetical protein